MQTVEVPDEILRLLQKSKLRDRPVEEQVRLVLAIHLLQEGVVSMGKAASIAGEPRASSNSSWERSGYPDSAMDWRTSDKTERPSSAHAASSRCGPYWMRVR